MTNRKITVAYGDGIGPEIMQATLDILEAAGAALDLDVIEIGEKVYQQGVTTGIKPSAWESLRQSKVFFKAPITTPQGGGFKSLNVTTRKTLGLFANVRPCRVYPPYISTLHPKMDVVIIRENEEDLYAGIEHQQTDEVVQCLKLISRPGSEKIIRFAFEYARAYNRKKVTCFTKDNIMKMSDGLFHKIFDEIGEEYPEIEKDHKIIDIASAILADKPETLDVIVTLNLYGDIVSDIAAQIAGSVGLGGSANIGEGCAMFEAIHGSAPDIAGMGIANPSGLINAAAMMLVHIDQPQIAEKVTNAWLKTIEDGIHTGDIYKEGQSKSKVGTKEFSQAVIDRIDSKPQHLIGAQFKKLDKDKLFKAPKKVKKTKKLVGVDVFIHWDEPGRNPNVLGEKLKECCTASLPLKIINNRGVKVYPDGHSETFCSDHWRCRYIASESSAIDHKQVIELLDQIQAAGFDFIKTEQLYTFDGARGYSLAQGE